MELQLDLALVGVVSNGQGSTGSFERPGRYRDATDMPVFHVSDKPKHIL